MSSIYSAELNALSQAINYVLNHDQTIISIQSIKKMVNRHLIVDYIQVKVNKVKLKHKSVSILWIQSHVNLSGNERAYTLAKNAANTPINNEYLLYLDAKSSIKKLIYDKWDNIGRTMINQKLLKHKNNTRKYIDFSLI